MTINCYFDRILDRVVGALIHGSRPFVSLISVGKAILIEFREELLNLNDFEDITKRLLSVSITVYTIVIK